MWDKVAAALLVLLRELKPYITALAAYLAGRQSVKAGNDAQTLERIDRVADAVSRNRAKPVDERLRDAKQRRLLRISDKPPNGE